MKAEGITHSGFDDFAEFSSAGLDDGLEVLERLLSLGLHTTLDDLHRLGVERDAARAEEEVARLDSLGIRADGGRCLCLRQIEERRSVSVKG